LFHLAENAVGSIVGIGKLERGLIVGLFGSMVALARARATVDSGVRVMVVVAGRWKEELGLSVEEDFGELDDDGPGSSGDDDLALGTANREKGIEIWLVWIL
jgi:hypothetical protein